jgi:hypothetical protein
MDTNIAPENKAEAPGAKAAVRWGSVALFIVFAFGISWLLWLGLGTLGVSFTIRVSIGMFGPALAAVIVRLIRHEGFADAGLRLVGRGHKGGWQMYIAAYLVPPILIGLSIVVVMVTGVQHWAYLQNLQVMAQTITRSLANLHQSLPKGLSAGKLAQIKMFLFALWLAVRGHVKAQPDQLPISVPQPAQA